MSYSPWGHKDLDMTEQLLWERDIRNLEQEFRLCLGAANVALSGVEMAGISIRDPELELVRLRVGGEGGDRGRDGWMASPTRWT